MNPEPDLQRLLEGIDDPRPPSEDFDMRLRAELFGSSEETALTAVPSDDAGAPRRRGPRRWVAVAAAAAAVALIVAINLARRPDQQLDIGDSAKPPTSAALRSVDTVAAHAACRTFLSTAFGTATRTQVIGPANASHLTSPEAVTAASANFRTAFEQLVSELGVAKVDTLSFATDADRVRGHLDEADRYASQGSATDGAQSLAKVEEFLINIDRTLINQGLPGCL